MEFADNYSTRTAPVQTPAVDTSTIDMPYTFGRPVESYVSSLAHIRLINLQTRLQRMYGEKHYALYSEFQR